MILTSSPGGPGLGFRGPELYNKSVLAGQAAIMRVIESQAGPLRGTAGTREHRIAWHNPVAPGASPTWIG